MLRHHPAGARPLVRDHVGHPRPEHRVGDEHRGQQKDEHHPRLGVEAVGFQGLVGPAGMPREVVERLSTELAKVVMEHGGKPMPEPWYKRILHRRSTKVIYLSAPVPIRIVD